MVNTRETYLGHAFPQGCCEHPVRVHRDIYTCCEALKNEPSSFNIDSKTFAVLKVNF